MKYRTMGEKPLKKGSAPCFQPAFPWAGPACADGRELLAEAQLALAGAPSRPVAGFAL